MRGERLNRDEAAGAITSIVRGENDDAAVAAFLVALAQRGESDEELIGGAQALRAEAVPFATPGGVVLDTCGTGGDGSHTFNISTVAAVVVAAGGVRVAKHGNRSVSSRCGSADVLEALGAKIDLGPEGAARVLRETGFCFLYARRFHPSMRHVAKVREALGVRTLFNWLGLPANPGARRITVGFGSWPARAGGPVLRRSASRALVVHGAGGLDELSLEAGNAAVWMDWGSAPRAVEIDGAALGLSRASVAALRGGTAEENAAIARAVLEGERGARRDAVVLNAAAAFWIADCVATLEAGGEHARKTIDSGAAAQTLARKVGLSRGRWDGDGFPGHHRPRAKRVLRDERRTARRARDRRSGVGRREALRRALA